MVAQKGREALLKVDNDGGEGFQTLAGTRTKSIRINNEQVDITNADSANEYRELLGGAGVRSIQIQCNGIFLADTYVKAVGSFAQGDTIRDWQYIDPGFGTFDGPFQIASFEKGSEHNGAATFDITLESAGDIAFTGS